MTVEIDPDFEPDPVTDAYMIEIGAPDFRYRLPLLLRGSLAWESRGVVHEYTCLPDRDYISRPTDQVRITLGPDRSSREKTLWQASLLEAELAEQPNNARTIFYLAQTRRELGDPAIAMDLYQRRARMGGWPEEVFYAMYRYALLLPSWPARFKALIEAWEFRPSRLEPVAAIARELNYRGQHHSALRFASIPLTETSDNLFVHRDVWDYRLSFERSIAEWWAGDKDAAYAMMDELLVNPRLPADLREATLRNRALDSSTP